MFEVWNENKTDAANISPKSRRDVFLWKGYSIIRDCYFQLSVKARQKEVLDVEKSSASNILSKFDRISWRSTTQPSQIAKVIDRRSRYVTLSR